MIIETAAPIFNKKGVAGTTVEDILDAAQVARGCLYSHFENKDDLSNTTVAYMLKRTNDAVLTACNGKKSAMDKIVAYLNLIKNPLITPTEGGCPIFNMAVEADNNNAVVKEMVKQAILSIHKFFASLISEGISNQEFIPTLNADNFAYKMFAAIEGTTVICRIIDSNKPMQNLIKDLKSELESYKIK